MATVGCPHGSPGLIGTATKPLSGDGITNDAAHRRLHGELPRAPRVRIWGHVGDLLTQVDYLPKVSHHVATSHVFRPHNISQIGP